VGLLFALAGVTIAIVQGGLVGRLSKAVGEWALVIAGPLLVTTAMLLLAELSRHPFLGLVIIALICNASGRSLQTPALSALISHTSDPKQQGTVFGLFHMLGSLARVIGPIIATGSYTKHHTAPYLIAASITAAMAIWSLVLKGQTGAPAYHQAEAPAA
jgi:predicted MFS family arabinose efflux permease